MVSVPTKPSAGPNAWTKLPISLLLVFKCVWAHWEKCYRILQFLSAQYEENSTSNSGDMRSKHKVRKVLKAEDVDYILRGNLFVA
eukprot:3923113-Amphidinium_carterae.1